MVYFVLLLSESHSASFFQGRKFMVSQGAAR